MAYCTEDQVKDFAEDDTLNSAVLAILIPSADGEIDRMVHRTFEKEEAAAKLYDLMYDRIVILRDDMYSLDSITTNAGGSYDSDDLVLKPYSGPPYRIIELLHTVTPFTYTGTPQQALTITGDWGWATVPSAVQVASILMVISAYNRKAIQGFQNVGMTGLTVTPADVNSIPPDALSRLMKYKRVRISRL